MTMQHFFSIFLRRQAENSKLIKTMEHLAGNSTEH